MSGAGDPDEFGRREQLSDVVLLRRTENKQTGAGVSDEHKTPGPAG